MEKHVFKLTFVLLVFEIICGCHNQTHNKAGNTIMNVLIEPDLTYACDGDTIRHAVIKYIDFDTISNLTGFFQELSLRYPIAKWEGEYSQIDQDIESCIAEIDAYRKGQRKYYPDILVRDCFSYMGFNIAATYNHNSEMADLVLAEWVMMCAAYYSPDITWLVETQTPDHRAGFYNFGKSYNPAPWWSYLFVKRDKGYQVFFLGDEVKVRNIFQLSDNENRTYYLCSNNINPIEFNQWLFWAKDDNTYLKVSECCDAPQKYGDENQRYYFDSKNLLWKYAKEERGTGRLIATEDTPAITLVLDGENSFFSRDINQFRKSNTPFFAKQLQR